MQNPDHGISSSNTQYIQRATRHSGVPATKEEQTINLGRDLDADDFYANADDTESVIDIGEGIDADDYSDDYEYEETVISNHGSNRNRVY